MENELILASADKDCQKHIKNTSDPHIRNYLRNSPFETFLNSSHHITISHSQTISSFNSTYSPILLNSGTMAEWRGIFFANAIVNFSREARCGGTTDHNDMFIWQNFGLPPSTIDNTDSALQNKKTMTCLYGRILAFHHPPLITLIQPSKTKQNILAKHKHNQHESPTTCSLTYPIHTILENTRNVKGTNRHMHLNITKKTS